MIRNILTTLIITILFCINAQAHIDIVYPTKKELTINGDTTFISGNTNSNAELEINGEPVKLWDSGFFVHVVDLDYGINKIKIESKHDGITEKEFLKVKRNRPEKTNKKFREPEYIKNENGILYAKTIKDRATLRSNYKSSSKRIIDIQKGVVLYLDGKQGDYYKLQEDGKTQLWIHKTNITEPVQLSGRIQAKLKTQKQFSDELYDYQKFYLTYPVPYYFEQKDNKIKLTLLGVQDENDSVAKNYEYEYEFANPILGYEFYYDENTLIFKKAKFPENIDEEFPLKGLNIFIDAGHGGKEKGTIGPSKILEKDINLDISKKLINANVFPIKREIPENIKKKIDEYLFKNEK